MIARRLNNLVTVTERAGIPATLDPPKINPPAAWVSARRLDRAFLNGDWAVIADIYLIARDNGIPVALAKLDELLTLLMIALDESEIEIVDTALDEVVTLPQGGSPLPAFRVSVKLED